MFHDDLLQLARRTFELDAGPGRPRQATLRRTISTAYYALFHLLVSEATSRMGLRGPDAKRFQRGLGRAFEHETMKLASAAIKATDVAGGIGAVATPLTSRSSRAPSSSFNATATRPTTTSRGSSRRPTSGAASSRRRRRSRSGRPFAKNPWQACT